MLTAKFVYATGKIWPLEVRDVVMNTNDYTVKIQHTDEESDVYELEPGDALYVVNDEGNTVHCMRRPAVRAASK